VAHVVVVVLKWRSHTENITCMTLVEDQHLLVTSSVDCTVRVWTLTGHYVGAFMLLWLTPGFQHYVAVPVSVSVTVSVPAVPYAVAGARARQ